MRIFRVIVLLLLLSIILGQGVLSETRENAIKKVGKLTTDFHYRIYEKGTHKYTIYQGVSDKKWKVFVVGEGSSLLTKDKIGKYLEVETGAFDVMKYIVDKYPDGEYHIVDVPSGKEVAIIPASSTEVTLTSERGMLFIEEGGDSGGTIKSVVEPDKHERYITSDAVAGTSGQASPAAPTTGILDTSGVKVITVPEYNRERYGSIINDVAKRMGVDPKIGLGLAEAENNLDDPSAHERVNSEGRGLGLLQVNPTLDERNKKVYDELVGKGIIKSTDPFSEGQLKNPEINVAMALRIWQMGEEELKKRGGGYTNRDLLTCYVAGCEGKAASIKYVERFNSGYGKVFASPGETFTVTYKVGGITITEEVVAENGDAAKKEVEDGLRKSGITIIPPMKVEEATTAKLAGEWRIIKQGEMYILVDLSNRMVDASADEGALKHRRDLNNALAAAEKDTAIGKLTKVTDLIGGGDAELYKDKKGGLYSLSVEGGSAVMKKYIGKAIKSRAKTEEGGIALHEIFDVKAGVIDKEPSGWEVSKGGSTYQLSKYEYKALADAGMSGKDLVVTGLNSLTEAGTAIFKDDKGKVVMYFERDGDGKSTILTGGIIGDRIEDALPEKRTEIFIATGAGDVRSRTTTFEYRDITTGEVLTPEEASKRGNNVLGRQLSISEVRNNGWTRDTTKIEYEGDSIISAHSVTRDEKGRIREIIERKVTVDLFFTYNDLVEDGSEKTSIKELYMYDENGNEIYRGHRKGDGKWVGFLKYEGNDYIESALDACGHEVPILSPTCGRVNLPEEDTFLETAFGDMTISCNGQCSPEVMAEASAYRQRIVWESFWNILQNSVRPGVGAFAGLFADDEKIGEWKRGMDKALCETYILGGQGCFESKICETKIDRVSQQGSMFVVTPGGNAYVAAHIEGERTAEIPFVGTESELDAYVRRQTDTPPSVEAPDEDEERAGQKMYFYKITFSVKNPENSGQNMMFNVVLKKDDGAEVRLYRNSLVAQQGKELKRAGENPIVQYSKKVYTEACIVFDNPVEISKQSERKVCNRISEYGGKATDYLSEQERTAASSQQGDVANEVDF